MRHALTTQGYGVRLRPVRLDDAPFIVWLRNLDHVKGRVGDSAADISSQERWLNNYFDREGDYYFIAETLHGIPLGTQGIYNVSGIHAEIGRNIVRPGVPAGVTALLLLRDLLHGRMGVTELRTSAVAGLHKVHSLICKGGFRQVEIEHAGQMISGEAVDMVHFVQNAEDWLRARHRFVAGAQRAESAIRKWEQAYRQGGSQVS